MSELGTNCADSNYSVTDSSSSMVVSGLDSA